VLLENLWLWSGKSRSSEKDLTLSMLTFPIFLIQVARGLLGALLSYVWSWNPDPRGALLVPGRLPAASRGVQTGEASCLAGLQSVRLPPRLAHWRLATGMARWWPRGPPCLRWWGVLLCTHTEQLHPGLTCSCLLSAPGPVVGEPRTDESPVGSCWRMAASWTSPMNCAKGPRRPLISPVPGQTALHSWWQESGQR
jgi:hypothetical protein